MSARVPDGLVSAAEQWFHQRWRDLRDDHSKADRVLEALELAKVVGIFSEERAELWRLRLWTYCPGHDDEGGRVWCAYCGNMPQATEEDSR